MCMWWLFTMLFVSFRVASLVSFGFVQELWGFVRLRPFVFFMDSFFFLAGSQARWPLPSISLLSLLASCFVLSLCYVTYDLLYHVSHFAMSASNHPFLANRCLAMSPLLLSPSYSVPSCRWRWSLFLVGTWIYWDITISLILINASIYLVKGGRLGLMPGVLFHSCRLSFRHIGVMFLDFASLTRWGVWDPLDSSLWIKFFQ